jgi:hypothetical protein
LYLLAWRPSNQPSKGREKLRTCLNRFNQNAIADKQI